MRTQILPSHPPSSRPKPLEQQLEKRMRGPQRHRLLQGYPLPPLMVPYDRGRGYLPIQPDPARPLIVGILPHASCNPSVQGCGYCTFPHEEFRVREVRQTVRAVTEEVQRSPLRGRRVEALYFGGGTANLTPPDVFSELCQAAATVFRLEGAEITLEGAPVYFTSRKEALLDHLSRHFPGSKHRLSMGVQTFDSKLIAQMGRSAIGSPESVHRAVVAASRRGMTTSADLLINLPGQSLQDMLADVRRASDLGFSQICLYHLVLFRGLGTPWAKDRDKLADLPDNEQAFCNWLAVRSLAAELGYRQKTLTNFERDGHYRYEECSYQPERFDGLGFGPEALSCFTDAKTQTAVKWMNEPTGAKYRAAMAEDADARTKVFVYGSQDLKVLHLTRTLPRLSVSRNTYKQVYGSDLVSDFQAEWQALESAGLVRVSREMVELTFRGMFFADSVAGLLAADRVAEIRQGFRPDLDLAPVFRMG